MTRDESRVYALGYNKGVQETRVRHTTESEALIEAYPSSYIRGFDYGFAKRLANNKAVAEYVREHSNSQYKGAP